MTYRPSERLSATILASSDYLNPHRFRLLKKKAGPLQITQSKASRHMGHQPTEASRHTPELQPEVSIFRGNRHNWNLLTGFCAPEVLSWLRGDEGLQSDFRDLFLSFGVLSGDLRFKKRARTDVKRKCSIAGRMGACCSTSEWSFRARTVPHAARARDRAAGGQRGVGAGSARRATQLLAYKLTRVGTAREDCSRDQKKARRW